MTWSIRLSRSTSKQRTMKIVRSIIAESINLLGRRNWVWIAPWQLAQSSCKGHTKGICSNDKQGRVLEPSRACGTGPKIPYPISLYVVNMLRISVVFATRYSMICKDVLAQVIR
ncbi:hypothetical protein M404DRAFT_792338 [Pisolithus tinctorius Marx 270]|uniref:Uncharacterized protein n=1 Tax=Pisolithus tinctorius Marx 270 TaxID=870435 RepID=A0A0C3PCW9_PISTI|nr:hypothetical protein M404DRAFT_792338 [Pisolithus tinctorius Marx 270]